MIYLLICRKFLNYLFYIILKMHWKNWRKFHFYSNMQINLIFQSFLKFKTFATTKTCVIKWMNTLNTWRANLEKRKEEKERRKKNKQSLDLSVTSLIYWRKQKFGNGQESVSDSKSFIDFRNLLRNWLLTLQLEVWDFLESLKEHRKIIM